MWEHVALELARRCGLRVPASRLELVDERAVLLIDRFDRTGGRRIGYVSALTMLEASDSGRRTYVELAEAVEEDSPRVSDDLTRLWRRIGFSILIQNTDDHLRNHGFLRSWGGWALSPAFDLNPAPDGGGVLSTAIADVRDRSTNVGALVAVAPLFRVTDPQAELRRLVEGTAGWRTLGERCGVGREVPRIAPAFEHAARRDAIRLASR